MRPLNDLLSRGIVISPAPARPVLHVGGNCPPQHLFGGSRALRQGGSFRLPGCWPALSAAFCQRLGISEPANGDPGQPASRPVPRLRQQHCRTSHRLQGDQPANRTINITGLRACAACGQFSPLLSTPEQQVLVRTSQLFTTHVSPFLRMSGEVFRHQAEDL